MEKKSSECGLQSIIPYFTYLIIKYLYYTKNTCIILSCIIQRQTILFVPKCAPQLRVNHTAGASRCQSYRMSIFDRGIFHVSNFQWVVSQTQEPGPPTGTVRLVAMPARFVCTACKAAGTMTECRHCSCKCF